MCGKIKLNPFFMIENFDLLFNFEKEKCVFMLSLQ